MAGLLNLVPRYLPPYGMAPDWARATRPLVLVFTAIAFVVTILFDADVDAQGGAYATGVLFLMTSAAVAVTIANWETPAALALPGHDRRLRLHHRRQHRGAAGGHQDRRRSSSSPSSSVSLLSRAIRSTELRIDTVRLDAGGAGLRRRGGARGRAHHRPPARQADGARSTTRRRRRPARTTAWTSGEPLLFLEVAQGDASDFKGDLDVRGREGRAATGSCAARAPPCPTRSPPCSSTSGR